MNLNAKRFHHWGAWGSRIEFVLIDTGDVTNARICLVVQDDKTKIIRTIKRTKMYKNGQKLDFFFQAVNEFTQNQENRNTILIKQKLNFT